VEVTSGGRLVYDPDEPVVVWTEAERAKGQAWGVETVPAFHTYGTPPVD
jgi:catechol 2,3-dioxygenase